MQRLKILVVTAHPDDLENGAGGTLVRLAWAGHRIFSLVMTLPSGENGRVRREESEGSHRILGAERVIFLEQIDGRLEATNALRSQVADHINDLAPDVIFTLWPADVHPDHRATADLAFGPALQRGINTELFCFEVCSSGRTSQDVRPQSLGFRPTHYVDVSMVLGEKRGLMDCHTSQDPSGMWGGIENMIRNRGLLESHALYAEAFVRLTRVGDLHPELARIMMPSPFLLPRGIGPDFTPEAIGLK